MCVCVGWQYRAKFSFFLLLLLSQIRRTQFVEQSYGRWKSLFWFCIGTCDPGSRDYVYLMKEFKYLSWFSANANSYIGFLLKLFSIQIIIQIKLSFLIHSQNPNQINWIFPLKFPFKAFSISCNDCSAKIKEPNALQNDNKMQYAAT